MKKIALLILLVFTISTAYSQVVIMPARTIISQMDGGSNGSFIGSYLETFKVMHPAYAECCDFVELNEFYDDYCQDLQNEAFSDLGASVRFYDHEKMDIFNEEDLFDVVRLESIKFQSQQGLFSNKKFKQTGKEIGEFTSILFEEHQVKYIVYVIVIALKMPSKFYDNKENEFFGNLGAYAWIVDCETGLIVEQAEVRRPTESSYSRRYKTVRSSNLPKYSRINQSDYKRINQKINNRIKRKMRRYM